MPDAMYVRKPTPQLEPEQRAWLLNRGVCNQVIGYMGKAFNGKMPSSSAEALKQGYNTLSHNSLNCLMNLLNGGAYSLCPVMQHQIEIYGHEGVIKEQKAAIDAQIKTLKARQMALGDGTKAGQFKTKLKAAKATPKYEPGIGKVTEDKSKLSSLPGIQTETQDESNETDLIG